MAFSRSKILPIAVVVLRVLLGGIFIYAGYVKLVEPWQLFAAGIALSVYRERLLALPDKIKAREGVFSVLSWR